MSKIKVTLKKSPIGYSQKQRQTLQGLGLRRLNKSRIFEDNPAIRGMIQKVSHLVEVEECKEEG
ncbi:MAG TPA: 50S ribosomal protein L30 [Deltaproteobacteria bacterium]|nr:50S ribosomal protein L30 [Deltaproteobacteria bacterium]